MMKKKVKIYKSYKRQSFCGAYFFVGLVGLLSMTACEKELTLPKVEGNKKLVLLGEMVADAPYYFRVGQSIPLVDGSNLSFSLPQNLSIFGSDSNGSIYNFAFYQDSLIHTLYTYPVTAAGTVKPLTDYRIEVSHPDMGVAIAEVKVPGGFGNQILDTSSLIYAGSPLFKISVQISDQAQEQNFYAIEALKELMKVIEYFNFNSIWYVKREHQNLYDSLTNAGLFLTLKTDTFYTKKFIRLPVFTDDPNSENLVIGNPLNVNKRILFQDKVFNGSSYFTNIYVDKKMFISNNQEEKGRVIIYVKSVAEEYFNFLKSYEQYDAQDGLNSLNKPTKIVGNVVNGLGVLGGVYQHQYIYIFDQWIL